MSSRRDRMRMNVEDGRISSLPDDLITKILSFVGAKQAVETSVLSSRWRFIWTKIPYFNFSSEDFSTLRRFHKFFTCVLSSCNNQVEFSLNLHGNINRVFLEKILIYACSHNLQKLTFTFLDKKHAKCPLSLFSSQSLKHLTLIGSVEYNVIPTSMWELPALTSLHLEYITLYDRTYKCVGLFSKCTNLKSLTLIGCRMMVLNGFTICHPQLSNITFKNKFYSCPNVINVVAPQLKNLTISNWDVKFRISAPNLMSLLYKNRTLKLSIDADSLPSLEKADLYISHTYNTDARKVVDLLQKFNRVKFLTLSLEVTEILSSSVEVIACEPSPFVNMRSLSIHPESLDEPQERKGSMATEVKNYLLDGSPSATFTLVTWEDIKAVKDAGLAQNLMAELRVLLDLEKHKEDKRPPLSQVHSYSEDLDTSDISTLVYRIKGLLKKIPESNKAELKPRFSSLSDEADAAISKLVNRRRAEIAQQRMEELRELLDLEKAQIEKHKEDKRPQCTTMPPEMWKREFQVRHCWVDLDEEINRGKTKTRGIMSLVRSVKSLLTKLSTPDKAELQSCFSSLCAEADIVISNIVSRMKAECDTMGSDLVVSFHEFLEAAQSSS